MPAPRAVPGEPAPGRLEITPHAPCREHRESEQQRRRLAADEQRAAARRRWQHARRRAAPRRAPRTLKPAETDGQRRPAALALADEVADLPEPRPAGRERPHPGVAPVGVGDGRRARQRFDPLRDDQRSRRRPVVAGRLLQGRCDLPVGERVVGGREEVAEELARPERRRPDLAPAAAPARSGARRRRAGARPRSAAGVQRRGSLPLVSRTCGARPSTPASETKWPATVLSRKRTIGVGPGSADSGERWRTISVDRRIGLRRSRPARRTTPREQSVGRRGCARPPEQTLRSWAIFVPARTATSTAVPTAMPLAASRAPDERRRTRFQASATT